MEGLDAAGHPHLPHIWSQRGESSSHAHVGGAREGEKVSPFPSVPQFLPVYMHVRVLVAAYLFQTGYGHFSFFWLKGDFSLYRVCQVSFPGSAFIRTLHDVLSCVLFPRQVLFRLNFLVLVLCVVMDRPYQFYYFVPLVTFWFFVIYGTLVVWPQILQKKANSRCQAPACGAPGVDG